MTPPKTSRIALHAALLVAIASAACGDDAPARESCRQGGPRLVLDGAVGETLLTTRQDETFGGRAGATFITPDLEEGDTAHVLSLTSNASLDVDLWTAVLQRLASGANDAGALSVSTRSGDLPCDPRDGEICAVYGLDTNRDGILLGTAEVIYPVESGDIRFTEVTGNFIVGDFDITFGPITSGVEEGGDRGGRLQGCFFLFREQDRATLF